MKKPGDAVKRGEIIAEVDTDKGVIEVEVFIDGIVEKLLIEPGTEVPVGTLLALIREEGEARPEEPLPTVTPSAEVSKIAATIPPAPATTRAHVSPAARKLATELGVDLSQVKGSESGGRMDFLNFVIALDEELQLQIPESDYPKLLTLDGCIEHLTQRTVTVHHKP